MVPSDICKTLEIVLSNVAENSLISMKHSDLYSH